MARILTFAVFLSLFWPFLGQEGMFLDGVTYGALARNMALGQGSFSAPHYTDTLFNIFYEQPPLGLWLESLLFRLLGDHFWVEKLFSFLMALGNGAMIVAIWRYVCAQTGAIDRKRFAWAPLLIWVLSPIVFWCFQQNMLETTMSLFTLLSVWFGLRALLERRAAFYVASALMIAAGALCKGPVAFFPAAAPVIYALFWGKKQFTVGAGTSALLILIAAGVLVACIGCIPGMTDYLDYYLHRQLFPTLAGAREKQVEFPLAFLSDLLGQLLVPLLLAGWAFFRKKEAFDRIAIFFLAMGLCGVLPLALSPKQSPHYLAPAMPFFALSLAWVIIGAFSALEWWRKTDTKTLRSVAWAVMLLVLVGPVWFWGKYSRDAVLISDIKKIVGTVPAGSTVGVPGDWGDKWLMHAYFERMGNISLDPVGEHSFVITQKNATFRPGFEPVIPDLNSLNLSKKNQEGQPEQ